MAIRYKINILEALKKKGYTSYKLRKNGLISESTISKFRHGQNTITLANLEVVCRLLNCQPGDVIEWVDDEV